MEKIGKNITLEQIQSAARQRAQMQVKADESLASEEAKALRDRQKDVMILLDRLQLDLNSPPLGKEELRLKAISFERHLTNAGLTPDKYERAYILAFQIYNNTDFGKGPFTVNHFIQAANVIRAEEHRLRTLPTVKTDWSKYALPPAPKCEVCRGTGLVWYTDSVGKRHLFFEVRDGKRQTKPCPLCCGEQIASKNKVRP